MKYYLLTFNEDWADEHNVPALACMNEHQYKAWGEKKNGKLTPNYEERKLEWDINAKKEQEFHQEMYKRNLWNRSFTTFTAEEREWYEANVVQRDNSYPTKVESSRISANLGNSGECFDEGYLNIYLMKELIEVGIVEATEVSVDFYETFTKANLSRLSLCNVFTLENDEEVAYDDEEEMEESEYEDIPDEEEEEYTGFSFDAPDIE